MKAVVLPEYGGPDLLKVRDVPEPKPGAGEIKLRVAAASLNPIDWKQRSGASKGRMPLTFPAILGRDASGTVVQVGPGVTTFQVGDKVLGRPASAHAEFAVGKADEFALVPPGLDLIEAGALPLVLLTGAQLAEEAADARAGQRVLVTGAAGSVGRVAVYCAKARGATVYAGVRKSQKPKAGELGADAIIALDDDAEIAALPQLDAIADTVGGETIKKLLEKVSSGGRIGSVVGKPEGAEARGLQVNALLTHGAPDRLAALARAVAEGRLTVPIAARFPFSHAADAHKLGEKGASGKILLTPA
jgi:NADPH:quinone reductase-like Zn-dependent oxidoreductase